MATMIPEEVREFHTEGEGRVYRFLEAVARPHERFLAWYTPDVKGAEPDFVLYGDDVGLLVLEVKDWLLSQIREATPARFVLTDGGRTEVRTNPLEQAKGYVHRLRDRIKADGRLVSKDPTHHGNPRVPLSYGVVFPNINKYEYVAKGLHQVIGTELAFFWDDLHPASDLCSDTSGRTFREALQERFPPRFPVQLSPRDLDHLRQLLFPVVRIELPVRGPTRDHAEQAQRLRVLDHHQEAIARKYDGGHRILVGPSGSGKTLILVHKADALLRYNPKVRRILFVCYNVTLVNFVRRLLAAKGLSLGEAGVDVVHFFELCARLTGEDVHFEDEDQGYYDLVLEMALARLGDGAPRYDAVLVDEGQDFSDDMLRVVAGLLNPETNHLTIALDERQDLYRRTQSWKAVGIQAKGRVHKISHVYRNTREIAGFAERVLGLPGAAEDAGPRQLTLFPDAEASHGPAPEVLRLGSTAAMAAFVADRIRSLADAQGLPFSEFAVLYTTKRPDPGETTHLPALLQKALEAKGVLSTWVSEDYRSKRAYDVTADRVTISTVHSAKGLDWACVFLLGLDALEPGERWSEAQIRSLAYVGMTRTRQQLFVPYVRTTPFVERILACR